jgi:EAL domain-containing protein (putative c-di-GMP-specific phosphodiesterase class I)
MQNSQEKPRILVVDDDDSLLRIHERALTNGGYQVKTAHDGAAAVRALEGGSYEVILSDIDVPVVLITGNPSAETAIQAMEQGALRYLVKPVELAALVKVTDDAVRLHRIAKAKRQALDLAGGVDRFMGDRAGLAASFDRALESFYIAYQPIVSLSARSVFAHEALLRSREPSLPHPGAMLDAAERLGRVHELGRMIRAKAIAPREPFESGVLLFLNLHPADLLDEELFLSTGGLAAMADRVVLEITERASLDGIRDVRARIASLRKLGFRIAVDDLGAGYAGLTSFTLLEPDVVKLDMALVRDVHREPRKQTVVRTMISMCKELGIVVTSEGIETPDERDELARAGCDLMQGFYFAKPANPIPVPVF